ncbi:MAG: DNA polymerase/3'-5' exonuclease PolX [Candidatus Parcubacteria bacterium]|nr:MAG: DNA polymerase/3'-5' exonuclease PolX [Candidatus Parcubacteria bacterium]
MAVNKELAKALRLIAYYLALKNIPFKPQAYEKAAYVIESLEEDIGELINKQGKYFLEQLPGVGKSIAEKIIEYLQSGKIQELENLKKELPVDIESLLRVEGIGPKMIYRLYKELNIKNIDDLKKACQKHRLRNIYGFGAKKEEKILKSLAFLDKTGNRLIISEAYFLVKDLTDYLQKSNLAEKIVVAGSYRRFKETIGDIDILVVTKNIKQFTDYFLNYKDIQDVYAKGDKKIMVRLENNVDVDIRVFDKESFGAALCYFTGSKDHNIALRKLALKKGWKLNEYGLFDRNNRKIAGATEEEIYAKLGLQFIPPELRENKGEIELALENKLPHLVDYDDLKGDLQVQSDWSDGQDSIETIAKAAIKFGLEYVCITDHTKSLKVANGLDEERILKQMAEIDRINKKYRGKIVILKGVELNILKNGSVDITDDVLSKLDFVGASVHSYFNLDKKTQTERIKKAMANKNIDCIFHPTGRLINKRPPYEVDIVDLIDYAKKTNTLLEINAYPDRLDLNDEYIRLCVDKGVKMLIDSDAHSTSHFSFLKFGIAQARRGWASAADILNTLKLKDFLLSLKQ